jgi:hypothetical protein
MENIPFKIAIKKEGNYKYVFVEKYAFGNKLGLNDSKNSIFEFKIIDGKIYIKFFNFKSYISYSNKTNNIIVTNFNPCDFIIEIIEQLKNKTVVLIGYILNGEKYYLNVDDEFLILSREKYPFIFIKVEIFEIPVLPIPVKTPQEIKEEIENFSNSLFNMILLLPGNNLKIYEERLEYVKNFYEVNLVLFDLILDGIKSGRNLLMSCKENKINSYYGYDISSFFVLLKNLFSSNSIKCSDDLFNFVSKDYNKKHFSYSFGTYDKKKDAVLQSVFFILKKLKYDFNNISNRIGVDITNYIVYELNIKEDKKTEKDLIYDSIVSNEHLSFHGTSEITTLHLLLMGNLSITEYHNNRNDFGFGTYLCESLSFVKIYGDVRLIFKVKNRNRSHGHVGNIYNIQSENELKLIGIVFMKNNDTNDIEKIESYFEKYKKINENCIEYDIFNRELSELDDENLFPIVESININGNKKNTFGVINI